MAQAPDNSSTQYAVVMNFTGTLAAGVLVRIEDAGGNPMNPGKPVRR